MDTGILITQMKGEHIKAFIYCESCLKMTTTSIKGHGKPIFSRKVVCEHCHKRIQAKTPSFYRTLQHGQYRRQMCKRCQKYRYERVNYKNVNTFPTYPKKTNEARQAYLTMKKEEDYFTSCICDEVYGTEWSEFFMVPPIKILAEELVLSGKANDIYTNNQYKGYKRFVEYSTPRVLEYVVNNSDKQYRLDFKYLKGYTIHISKKEDKLWITPETGKFNILIPRKIENLNDVKYIYHQYEYNNKQEWFDYIDNRSKKLSKMITSLGIQSKFEAWEREIYEHKRQTLMHNISRFLFARYERDRLELLDLKDLAVLSRYPNIYHFWCMTNYTFYSPYEIYQIIYSNERIISLYKQELPLHDFLSQYRLGYFTKQERQLIYKYPLSIALYSNVLRYVSNVDERKKLLIRFNALQTSKLKDMKGIQIINKTLNKKIIKLRKIFRQFLSSKATQLVIEKFVVQVTLHFWYTKYLRLPGREEKWHISLFTILGHINKLTEDVIEELNILLNMGEQEVLTHLIGHYYETNQSIINFEKNINQAIMDMHISSIDDITSDKDFVYSDEIRYIYNDDIGNLHFRLAKSSSYLKLMSKQMKICVGYVSYYETSILDESAYIIHAYDNNVHVCLQVDHHLGEIVEAKTKYNQIIDTLGEEIIEKIACYQTRIKHKRRKMRRD